MISDYVALAVNDDVGNILCTSQVYRELASVPKFEEVKLRGVFDTFKKELVINNFEVK